VEYTKRKKDISFRMGLILIIQRDKPQTIITKIKNPTAQNYQQTQYKYNTYFITLSM